MPKRVVALSGGTPPTFIVEVRPSLSWTARGWRRGGWRSVQASLRSTWCTPRAGCVHTHMHAHTHTHTHMLHATHTHIDLPLWQPRHVLVYVRPPIVENASAQATSAKVAWLPLARVVGAAGICSMHMHRHLYAHFLLHLCGHHFLLLSTSHFSPLVHRLITHLSNAAGVRKLTATSDWWRELNLNGTSHLHSTVSALAFADANRRCASRNHLLLCPTSHF